VKICPTNTEPSRRRCYTVSLYWNIDADRSFLLALRINLLTSLAAYFCFRLRYGKIQRKTKRWSRASLVPHHVFVIGLLQTNLIMSWQGGTRAEILRSLVFILILKVCQNAKWLVTLWRLN